MPMTTHLDIVSAEEEIFNGRAQMVIAMGSQGELGIAPNHAPLLTNLVPGTVRVITQHGEEQIFYVSGGMLEVQPHLITILADTAARAGDMDEAAAKEAEMKARELLNDQSAEIDYSKATAELAEAMAQLRTIQSLRRKAGK
ncbi:MAG: F0F1 ATP synthase subunit epsilon [Pseudomonadota bacterium]